MAGTITAAFVQHIREPTYCRQLCFGQSNGVLRGVVCQVGAEVTAAEPRINQCGRHVSIAVGYQSKPRKSWTGVSRSGYLWGLRWVMATTSFSSTTNRDLQWLTAAEAATYLRIKPRTLLHWVRMGKIRGFALSGTKHRIWRFLIADLDAALLKESVLGSETLSVSAEREEQ
jgi:excisionase family DNA binding protein